MCARSLMFGMPHVAAHELQLGGALDSELLEEAQQRFHRAIPADPEQPLGMPVDLVDHRQVLVPPAPENLVHANRGHTLQVPVRQPPADDPIPQIETPSPRKSGRCRQPPARTSAAPNRPEIAYTSASRFAYPRPRAPIRPSRHNACNPHAASDTRRTRESPTAAQTRTGGPPACRNPVPHARSPSRPAGCCVVEISPPTVPSRPRFVPIALLRRQRT